MQQIAAKTFKYKKQIKLWSADLLVKLFSSPYANLDLKWNQTIIFQHHHNSYVCPNFPKTDSGHAQWTEVQSCQRGRGWSAQGGTWWSSLWSWSYNWSYYIDYSTLVRRLICAPWFGTTSWKPWRKDGRTSAHLAMIRWALWWRWWCWGIRWWWLSWNCYLWHHDVAQDCFFPNLLQNRAMLDGTSVGQNAYVSMSSQVVSYNF